MIDANDLDTLQRKLETMTPSDRRAAIKAGVPTFGLPVAAKDPGDIFVSWDSSRVLIEKSRGSLRMIARPDLDRAWCLISGSTNTRRIIGAVVARDETDALAQMTDQMRDRSLLRLSAGDTLGAALFTESARDLVRRVCEASPAFVLRSVRSDLGLTSVDFALYLKEKGVKVSAAALRNYERGARLPSPEIASGLENALGLPAALECRSSGRHDLKPPRSFFAEAGALRRAGLDHPIASREPSAAPVKVSRDRGSRWRLSLWIGAQWSPVDGLREVGDGDIKRLWREVRST